MRIACCAEQTTPTSSRVARVEGDIDRDRSPEPSDAIVFDPISAPLMLVSLSLNKRTVTYTGRGNHSNDFGRYNLVLAVLRCVLAAVVPVQNNTELYFAIVFLLCIIQRPRQIPDFGIKAISCSLLCRDEDGANESRSWNIGSRKNGVSLGAPLQSVESISRFSKCFQKCLVTVGARVLFIMQALLLRSIPRYVCVSVSSLPRRLDIDSQWRA
jgi:hypothetical protein